MGTAPTPTVTKYTPQLLKYSFLSAVRQIDPEPTRHGFSLMSIEFKSGDGLYNLYMMRRAVKGALEEDYHAILSREEDEARVVVYVTGPDKEIRTKVIRLAEAHYGQRPKQLNCVFTRSERGSSRNGVGSIRWRMCYPRTEADFMLTEKDLSEVRGEVLTVQEVHRIPPGMKTPALVWSAGITKLPGRLTGLPASPSEPQPSASQPTHVAGGGVYRPGEGITLPRVLREVKPNYTPDALRAKIAGTVELEAVVLPDGRVGDVRIVHSLDAVFGLDEEAIKAVKQWRFAPGTRDGVPVPVLVGIQLTFTPRSRR